jgi:hypothetical protein
VKKRYVAGQMKNEVGPFKCPYHGIYIAHVTFAELNWKIFESKLTGMHNSPDIPSSGEKSPDQIDADMA